MITYKGLEYNIVQSPITGRFWLDRNLGANRIAQSINDKEAFGDYYQWGRISDGHEKINSLTVDELITDHNISHNCFVTSTKMNNYDWLSVQNDNLWLDMDNIKEICPPGFRLPTKKEMIEEKFVDENVLNSSDAFNCFLRLPSAGYRYYKDASISRQGQFGDIWTSSVDEEKAISFHFYKDDSFFYSNYRANAYSIRCIKD